MASGQWGDQDSGPGRARSWAGLRRAPALSQRRAEAATLNPWARGPRDREGPSERPCLGPGSW